MSAAGRRRGLSLSAACLCAALFVALATPAFAQTRLAPVITPMTVEARPIRALRPAEPGQTKYGALEFRGGLALTSPSPLFGGLSGLRLSADGTQFLTVSDHGRWFSGRIVYRDGRPEALADIRSAPALGGNGRAVAGRGWYDTESIASDGDIVWLGIERVHQVVRFDFSRGGILARGEAIALPPAIAQLPNNESLEGLVAVPKDAPRLGGALIAFSERGLNEAGDILAFIVGGRVPGTFAVKRRDRYDISDAAILPGGDVLLLERRVSILRGWMSRIRRIPLASIAPGAVVDGKVLFEAESGSEIDNMEGLAVHRNAAGETILTLVSDDNFSVLQRTLLLQFALTDP